MPQEFNSLDDVCRWMAESNIDWDSISAPIGDDEAPFVPDFEALSPLERFNVLAQLEQSWRIS